MKWENYGESSLTLLAVYSGMNKKYPAIPYDKHDFKRCLHLFTCLELLDFEIEKLLYETSCKYKIWKPFKENWNNLLKLYKKKNKNKFYELINKLK